MMDVGAHVTWFADLTPYTYLRTEPTNPPTLNVGWLAHGRDFAKGNVPQRFVTRIQELCKYARTQQTRGLHPCELCPDEIPWDDSSRLSSAEIRAVGDDGTRYAAPTLILHYVTAHGYAPPEAFIAALLRMQGLAWNQAEASQLCMSCGNKLIVQRHPASVELFLFWCEGCATKYMR
jgi:hypothetical protein